MISNHSLWSPFGAVKMEIESSQRSCSIVILYSSKDHNHKRKPIMQNKKLFIVLSLLVLIVGGAAFVAGRMLNSNINPLGFFRLGGKGDVVSVRINVIPAEELPKTQPEVIG